MNVSIGFLKLFTLSIILSSCGLMKTFNPENYYTPIPESTKTIDIPKYGVEHQFNGYPYVYWNFCKQKESQLGLESPETSKDSLIFRMWITNPVGTKNQPHGLIEIKYDNQAWSGKLILMHVNYNTINLTETITDFKSTDLSPLKSDWSTVFDSLMKFKIDVLPTDDLIPDYYSNNDGYSPNTPTFSFEFATKDIYRFYQYNDLDRAVDKFWQPKNVQAILELLENEFQWDTKARQYF